MTTEKKILDASNFIFLQYGYHGTTIQKIAKKADAGKSLVHYYFRSKDNLYRLAIKNAFDLILNFDETDAEENENAANSTWFITTELHNNKVVFLHVVDELYPKELSGIISKLNRKSGIAFKLP
jgi:AcrR family transcriptional regulator